MSGALWIKICGLSTPESVEAAVAAGADAVGFVFAPGSPRWVSADLARSLVEGVPAGVETVGVFRDQPIDEILRLARASGVATVQLHGHEGPDVFHAVRGAGYAVIRALSAETFAAEPPDVTATFGEARLLLDAPDPGAGRTFDESSLETASLPPAWILAGGLTSENVGRLATSAAPGGVDVSSGVESSRGVKDAARIRRFVAAARSV